MSSHERDDNIDILRKVGIVAVLVGGMWLLHRFGSGGGEIDPTAMLALGFVVLASYTFGELVGVIKLPHVTGYLAAGLILGGSVAGAVDQALLTGPEWLGATLGGSWTGTIRGFLPEGTRLPPPFDDGVLNQGVVDQLSLFNTLAVALIAMSAGGELKIEALRKGLRVILGVLGGQVVLVGAGMMLFVLVISGTLGTSYALPFPGQGGSAFGGLDFTGVLLLGGVLAAISIATSPAATIAVINSTRAKGPVTSTILSAVVMKDVVVVLLFSVVAALASGWIDPAMVTAPVLGDAAHHAADATHHAADAAHAAEATGGSGGFVLQLVWHIFGSLAIGVAVGFGMAMYLRYVGVEILLFLVGVVFAIAYAGTAAGLDSTLLFIAAGFASTNFSKEGDQLIHEVEKLGMPVYVVFFTLTGASLHLESLMALAPFAAGLVFVRGLGIWGGVQLGARLAKAPEAVVRHSWLGFISQAGVAIALAGLVAQRFGDTGAALSDLIIAGVAVHEVFGPIMLKVALGMAQELPSGKREHDDEEEQAPAATGRELPVWTVPEGLDDPWGPLPDSASDKLVEVASELRADLQSFVADVEQGGLADWAREADEYLNGLRREFLRHHRHVTIAAGDQRGDLQQRVRQEQADLADRWRDLVLARSAEVAQDTWSPIALIEAVDDLIATQPERIEAPYEQVTLQGHPDENALRVLQRSVFVGWYRVSAAIGGEPPTRPVAVQALVRYHFGGLVPGRLEGLAALLVAGEQHLHRRTRSLFLALTDAYDALLKAGPDDLDEALAALRADIESEFALARGEVNSIAAEGAMRAARILGETLQDWYRDLESMGTLDLPTRARRYSRVFNQRTRGLTTFANTLPRLRKSTAARYDSLALELELAKLEGRIKDLVEQHGDQLARNVGGKGTTQVGRVEVALRDALLAIQGVMLEDESAANLARLLRVTCEPLEHIAEDAARSATRLRDQLNDNQSLSALLDSLLVAARDLTERYTVPVGPDMEGEWNLPNPTTTVEVPFRDIVNAFIESSVTRDLSELARGLASDAETLVAALEEFDRIVAFNVELATGELDLVDGEVPDATKDLVHDMIVGNLTRAAQRLATLRERTEGAGNKAAQGVRDAVLGELEKLRAQVQDGRVSELRVRLLREAAAGRRLVSRAGGLQGLVRSGVQAADELLQGTLGAQGLFQAQRLLGLRTSVQDHRPEPRTFAESRPIEGLPLVYRRLFSDVAMEAGDQLTGRRTEMDRARRVLDGGLGGRLRSVALVGPAGVGKRAIVSALVRKVDTREVRRIPLDGPVTADEVKEWFDPESKDQLIVVDGFEWLFSMEPGGMGPLRAFTQGLVQDDGRNRWLIHVHTPLWRFADRVSELHDAFAEVIRLEPLDVDALSGALLARHAMSGYELHFEGDPGLGWQLRAFLRPGASADDRPRQAWFAALHGATGGLLNDALRLWMASINHVDEDQGVVRIGDIPVGPLSALRSLPDDDLLTLRQVARQGVMPVRTHAWLFRTSDVRAEAHLGHLAHLGLLQRRNAGYAVPPHLQGPVSRVLDEKGWTE